jgi:peptidoglycan/LPS O-acetylase OafA/YrhL
LASGPFSPRFQEGIARRCDATWWSELTYTMNFINSDNVCMGWSWYLGDDMIFFIVSIAILPIYHKKRWMGWVTVITLTAVSLCVTAWLVLKYGLTIYAFDDHYKEYSFYAYSKPYTRVPAYFVGLAAAWLLDEMEQKGITRETKPNSAFARWFAFVAAILAVAVLVFLTLIVGTDFGDHTNSWDQHPWASVLYIDFSRPIWAVCCAVITLLCYYDYLPLVNGFLSHPYWTPLARLTYGAYLVHPLVIKLAAGMAVQYYTFTALDLVSRWFGNIIMAYSGSVVLWCLVERPCMTIFAPPRKPIAKTVNSATPNNSLGQEELDSECRRQISRTNSWNSNPEILPTLSDALSCSHEDVIRESSLKSSHTTQAISMPLRH